MDGDEHFRATASPAARAESQEIPAERADRRPNGWRRWAFAALPAIGLLELCAHLVQANSTVRARDWGAARDYVVSASRPEDLVTFAPAWVDPIGRQEFGSELATLQREARPDETRFPRAFEVAVHKAHDPTLHGWRRTDEHTFGGVRVTTLENPAPARVLDDLVSLIDPQRMEVLKIEGARSSSCPFSRSAPQSGGLGAGPALPADRFSCAGGGFVATSVVADLAYRPHRCIYAPPLGAHVLLRIRFLGVRVGHALHGHHGLYVEAERDRRGAPITLTFRIGDEVVGSVVHQDGDGWKPFEFDTDRFLEEGQRQADIVADIEAPSGERRMYCFEADTR